ncbi:exodeoxyribonuclease III [bacterium]|nr:MAG: exodeoxyribonuclease III [bacterium]
MQIVTLNVNGIRSATTKGLDTYLTQLNADIICFQELKALEDQVPDEIKGLPYHQYYHSAEKKGYSGVGILSKTEPLSVQVGCGIDWIDSEGRVLIAEFDTFFVFSMYFPSGTTGDERQNVKYQFLDAIYDYLHDFKSKTSKDMVICGDYNIAHKEIDIHNPVSNKNSSGFLPEERAWFTKFLESGFNDVFREQNEGVKDVYSWWSFRAGARKNNKGWRIDYQISTPNLAKKASHARIDGEPILSDHAAVIISYDL